MALNCKISKGVKPICDLNVGGIKKIAFTNWSEDFEFTTDNCEVTAIDLGTEKFYEVAIEDQSGVATADLTIGSSNDSKSINHTVSGQIARIDCNMLSDWKNYLLGTVVIAVMTNNKEVYLFGVDNGLVATTFSYSTGTANGDANGINFVYEGAQTSAPLKVADWGLIKALFAE